MIKLSRSALILPISTPRGFDPRLHFHLVRVSPVSHVPPAIQFEDAPAPVPESDKETDEFLDIPLTQPEHPW